MKNNLHGNQEGLTARSAEVNLVSYAQRTTLDLVHGRAASPARFFDNRKGYEHERSAHASFTSLQLTINKYRRQHAEEGET